MTQSGFLQITSPARFRAGLLALALATGVGLSSPAWREGLLMHEAEVAPPPVPAAQALPAAEPELSLPQQRVAQFIAEEWDLESHYATTVVRAAYGAAQRYALDPFLLLAMAAKESAFRHIGNPGGGQDPLRPYGIMQVAGRFHPEKFEDGVVRPTGLAENVRLGAQVVREYLDREKGNVRRALLRYNGSLHKSGEYFQSVSRLRKKLLEAASDEEGLGA